jgi:hypothetical protein
VVVLLARFILVSLALDCIIVGSGLGMGLEPTNNTLFERIVR